MKRRRTVDRVLQAKLDELRYMTRFAPGHGRLLAIELMNGATELMQRGAQDDALALLDELVTVVQDGSPVTRDPDNLLITALAVIGSIHLERGRIPDADDALAEAVALAAAATPGDVADQHASMRANNLIGLARCRELAGSPDEALGLLPEAFDLLRGVPESDPQAAGLLHAARQMRDRLQPS